MFKNLIIYRLPAPWAVSSDHLDALLAQHAFTPCASVENQSQGWDAPRGAGLVHSVNGQYLIKLVTEKKLLPASVITEVVKARAVEIEEQQGFKPGRKLLREIKEQVTDELIARAFSVKTSTSVWIDPKNGWLCIDTSSTGKADDVLKLLLKSISTLPIEMLRVKLSPIAAMTDWLAGNEAPAGFTIDMDTELRSKSESKAKVRYSNQSLDPDEIAKHIAQGKQCTRLSMTWKDKISFVLTENLTIKSIKLLDVLSDHVDGSDKNDDERFDGQMALMAGEFAQLVDDVVASLGGEAADLASPAGAPEALVGLPAVAIPNEDILYAQAVQTVKSNHRASISLVQRVLRIGYNHAARLIEKMELDGIVSAIAPNGQREVQA